MASFELGLAARPATLLIGLLCTASPKTITYSISIIASNEVANLVMFRV